MNIIDLLKDFEEDKIIKEGIISVFSDTVGKPGDRILRLVNIECLEENLLIFRFGKNEIIQILNPKIVQGDNLKIVISDSSEIIWKSSEFELIYRRQNSILETKLVRGAHVFKTRDDAPSFEYISW